MPVSVANERSEANVFSLAYMPNTEEIVSVGMTSLPAVLLLTSLVTAVFLIWSFSFLFMAMVGVMCN